jgi:hypothetical protein
VRAFAVLRVLPAILALGLGTIGCKGDPDVESRPYFDRTIAPILQGSCSRQTTGCHLADPKGNAVGNLDTSSFEMIDKRRDLLVTYGPYSAPGLLTKVAGPQTLSVSTLDGTVSITTDVRHAAGAGIDVTSDGYATLRRWMDTGATRANVGPVSARQVAAGPCKATIPTAPGFDPNAEPGTGYAQFVSEVQPILKNSCSAGSCHGNDVADLKLTCGDTEEQRRWNFFIAKEFVAKAPEASEIVRRPLDPAQGGAFHEGGPVFDSANDEGYLKLLAWAKVQGPPASAPSDPGFRYFANRVQPTMVRKGCMFLGCHSPSMFHDLRLAGGTGGQFSLAATKRNYESSKLMLAIESPDPNVSRLVQKNLYAYDPAIQPDAIGARHRGGPLLEDVPGDSGPATKIPTLDDCKSYDLEEGDLNTIPGWCVFARWHQIERQQAITKGPAGGGVDPEPLAGIVYVDRPPNTDVPQAFDVYRPGAELHIVAATLGEGGAVTLGVDRDVTADCGLADKTADIRGPAVSRDGKQIAFAARSSVDAPLSIYVMNADGSGCSKQATIGDHEPKQNGILIHDFDPAWAPDGRLVFASTRGAIGQSDLGYTGPTRTPSTLQPNSNIYILEGSAIRQLTFLLNAELAPAFMADGRVIFTTEKRAPGFYQLAGRRQNLDGGDYHPFFAQRRSLGFDQLTEPAELASRNFVGILSDKGALAGAGTIGIVNRSLGPDQDDRDPADRFYLGALSRPDRAATGKRGGNGAYRSPSPLPGHGLIASYAAGDPYAFDGAFELVQIDERTGVRRTLIPRPAGRSIVDAAAIYARVDHGVFHSRFDEANGATTIEKGARDAVAQILDLPLLASLLFENTRVGRTVDPELASIGVLESLPPPIDLLAFDRADPSFLVNDEFGPQWVQRTRLGVVAAEPDGSLGLRLPGGMPFVLELYKASGTAPHATQREEMQLMPGERARVAFKRDLFDAQCGGCHGSISGREVDVHLRPDVLTGASRVESLRKEPASLVVPPAARGPFVPAPTP